MTLHWTKAVRAGVTSYTAETPLGRIKAKMHRTHGGAMQPRVTLPDGKYVSGRTMEDAMSRAEDYLARAAANTPETTP